MADWANESVSPCPACRQGSERKLVELRRDPIQGKEYHLCACMDCGTVFSEPRVAVSADWYSRAHMCETFLEGENWRYTMFFEEKLGPGKLLDIGCGAGQFLLAAQGRGFRISGVDFNPRNIEQAKASGLQDVWAMDWQEFFKDRASSYDVVTLFDVLEHVPEPAELLPKIYGALRPGGYLAITVPNAERPLFSPKNREEWDYPPYHFTRWTAAGLRKTLERAGFKLLRFQSSPLPLDFFSGLFYYRILNAAFPILKRLLLGAAPSETSKTWTELLSSPSPWPSPLEGEGGVRGEKQNSFKQKLADSAFRQRLTNAGFRIFSWILCPLEIPWVLGWRALRPNRGRLLYVKSQKPL